MWTYETLRYVKTGMIAYDEDTLIDPAERLNELAAQGRDVEVLTVLPIGKTGRLLIRHTV